MAEAAPLLIRSLRGGQNTSDPPVGLPDDQAVLMENVELVASLLGERRLGTDAVTLSSIFDTTDRISFLHRRLPSDDLTASELWALGIEDSPSQAVLGRKTTAWSSITLSDTPSLSGFDPY